LTRIWPVLLTLLGAGSAAFAQDQNKLLEEERRRAMDARPRGDDDLGQRLLWDAGGWLHAEVITLDDPPDEEERTLRYLDLRLWGELRLDRTYTAYLRLQTDYVDFNSGDQFEGDDDNEFRFLYVDQAWAEADWSTEDTDFVVRAGRQFISLGRGLLFNQVAYGVVAEWAKGRWGLKAFGAHSIIHDDDLDQSLPNHDDSRRAYGALEANYVLHGYHRAYAMFMFEKDLNDEDPESAAQDWDYDAQYLGAGLRGAFFRDLGYHIEAIYQMGRSVAAGTTDAEDIRAFSLTLQAEYRFQAPMSPAFLLEYLYGSGDSDRGSVTDVAAGNAPGSDDEGFLGFGFLQTGYALFPRVSNIHIFRLGGSFKPLETVDACRYLEVGVFGYLYRKAESAAPISDPRSFLDDAEVGTEIDLFLRWRILSDLGMSVNFGRFLPGDAYDDTDGRNFFSAGFTYGF
jgi:hypothetical protein